MSVIRELARRLMVLLKLKRIENEIDEEMRFHIEMLAEEKRESGLNDRDAKYAARRQFGNPGVLKERSRDAWGWAFLERLAQDLRQASRTIIRTPMQTLLIVATLGLAMAANLGVFSLLDELVLRPLPVEKPGDLVGVSAPPLPGSNYLIVGKSGSDSKPSFGMNYTLFKTLRDQVDVLKRMVLTSRTTATLVSGGDPVPVKGSLVMGEYFDLLGVKAQLGRTLTADDDRDPNGDAPVVLSHGFWQRQFGGDPSILHRTIRLNSMPMVVVGITTPGFTGTGSGWNDDFFTPLNQAVSFMPYPGFKDDDQNFSIYFALARLAPGVDIQQAELATDTVYQRLLLEAIRNAPPLTAKERDFWKTLHVSLQHAGYASSASPRLGGGMKTPLQLLMAMVALLLIVAAGNVANLLLARRMAGAQATAIRFALGSSRWRILRELLVESLLLSAGAAILGYFMASWAVRLIPVLLDMPNLPANAGSKLGPGSNLLAIGLALIIGIGIWGASAVRATKRSRLPALTENAAPGGAPQAVHWRRGMVVLQISFSLILLCSSFVLLRSLWNLMSVDPGFPIDNVYTFSINYGQSGYEGARAEALLDRISAAAQALPGVRMVSMTDKLLLTDDGANIEDIYANRPASGEDAGFRTESILIGPGYFRTIGIPMISGREFTSRDWSGAVRVAVVNESLARMLYGKSDPIGRRILEKYGNGADWEIVGVVKDTKNMRDSAGTVLYLPVLSGPSGGSVKFVLKTSGPAVTLDAVRAAVKQVDASIPATEFGSLADHVSRALYRDRALAMFSLCFAGLASVLCAIGVFGLTSYSIAGRTKEIGVRIALGANSGSIYRLVLKEIVLLSIIGCSVGLAVFIAVSRVLASMLFKLTPTDPVSLIWATLVLGLTTFLAGFIPSRRAARLDPSVALHWE